MKTEKIINIIGILGVIGSLIFKEYYRLTRSSRLRMVGAEGRTLTPFIISSLCNYYLNTRLNTRL